MKYQDFDNPMRRQLISVPKLLSDVYTEIEKQTRYVLTTPQIYLIKKVIITGCGDCYAAALSAKRAFEEFLEIPIEVVPPVDLARFYQMKWVGESPCDPLVIAVSNSGEVVRIIEAVKRMRKNKALTLAISSNEESSLIKESEKKVIMDIPPFESSPGVRSYSVVLMTLLLLAIRFGEVRLKYPMSVANTYRKQLVDLPALMIKQVSEMDEMAFSFAKQLENATAAELIGAGYDMGTAYYGYAKMYEAVGLPASYVSNEDWFHLNYFARDIEKIITIVIADKSNNAASRTKELVARLKQMGRKIAVISNDSTLKNECTFLMPPPERGVLSSVTAFWPLVLIAGYLSALRGEQYSRGFESIWKESEDMPSTTVSKIEILD